MSNSKTLGIIGGVLVALSVFFNGNTATFDLNRLKGGATIVTFAAGLLLAILLALGNRTWAAFATIAATTVLLIALIDGNFALSLDFILLTVGVVLGLIATVFGKK